MLLRKRQRIIEDEGDTVSQDQGGSLPITDGSFVIDDDAPIVYDSDVNASDVEQDIQMRVAQEEEIDANINPLSTRKSALQQFQEAMCIKDDIRFTEFFDHVLRTKLEPALRRGQKTDAKRLDELIKFVLSEPSESTIVPKLLARQCDLCLTQRDLSLVFANGKDKYVVGACCGDHLRSSRKLVDLLMKQREEFQQFSENQFATFSNQVEGLVFTRSDLLAGCMSRQL